MTKAQDFFKQAALYTDDIDYVMIKLHPRAIIAAAGVLAEIGEPFGALLVDKDEVTLIIAEEVLEDFTGRLPGAEFSGKWRLITFDIELPPDLTGFMALLGKLLGEVEIPIIPLGAYSRDHVLVPADRFEQAWQYLKEQQSKL